MSSNKIYIPAFDGLRAIAAVFVLLLHGSYGFFAGGWLGVDLFFVLSGFLITNLLQQEFQVNGKIEIIKFYMRRALRLLPALFICVLMANILWPYTTLLPDANKLLASFGALFYFTNVLNFNISGNIAHLWSLSVEEHFYLFWPFLAAWIIFKRSYNFKKYFISLIILLISIIKIYAFKYEFNFAYNNITIDTYRFTLFRIDAILLGALLAIILSDKKNRLNTLSQKTASYILIPVLLAFIFLLFKYFEGNAFSKSGGFIFTNLLCVMAIYLTTRVPNHLLLANKAIRWIGVRSYGIYIYHFPIFLYLERFRVPHNNINFLMIAFLRFAITIFVSWLSFKYIESVFLRKKIKFEVS